MQTRYFFLVFYAHLFQLHLVHHYVSFVTRTSLSYFFMLKPGKKTTCYDLQKEGKTCNWSDIYTPMKVQKGRLQR